MSTPPLGYARALRPDEQALFDELTRAQVQADGVQVEVGVISWPSSHQPQLAQQPPAAAGLAAGGVAARRQQCGRLLPRPPPCADAAPLFRRVQDLRPALRPWPHAQPAAVHRLRRAAATDNFLERLAAWVVNGV